MTVKDNDVDGFWDDMKELMKDWAYGCPKCNRIGLHLENGCYYCGYNLKDDISEVLHS